jgi:hypothetical protein
MRDFYQTAQNSWSKSIALTLMLFSLAVLSSLGQSDLSDFPVATLTEEGKLILPADQPLAETYLFDLSQFEFENSSEMVAFLSNKSGEGYIVRAVPSQNKGVLMLNCSDKQSWTCSDWNEHLLQKTTELPIKPE